MNPDARTDLFSDGYNAVTRSWIHLGGVQYAVKYVDQTTIKSYEPSRKSELGVLFVCVLLAFWIFYRIVANELSLGLGWLALVACAVVILMAGYAAFMKPNSHQVHVRFKNGEQIVFQTKQSSTAHQFQNAILSALDYLDYHDTDAAKPTVVLASVEPTQLTAIAGSKADVVRIDDAVLKDAALKDADKSDSSD